MLSKLQALGRWIPSARKLGVNGARGEFAIIDRSDDDRWELFYKREETGNQLSIQPNIDNLLEWGIDETDAYQLITVATNATIDGFT